jgi:threonine/homoserine efflux transporter RhtA
VGALFLDQHLAARAWFAIALVVIASAGAALEITGRRTEPPQA